MDGQEESATMVSPSSQIKSYVLGDSEPEKGRLLIQAQLYDPYTEAVLRESGLQSGMKVLDVGCGIGNLSLLAARLIGASGQVIGIDVSERVTQISTQRAKALGLDNVGFMIGDLLALDLEGDFDAIIGRLILLHIEDPVDLLKQLASHLRPGGILLFEEIASLGIAHPDCYHIECVNKLYTRYFETLDLDLNFGHRLPQIFQAAGLETPALNYFAPAGTGPDWPGYRWLAEGIRAHMPALQLFDPATDVEIDINTLEEQIREEAVRNEYAVTVFPHIAAWVTIP